MYLLTNDDGIDAPGLAALGKAISGKGIVVAPATHQSGVSHRVTALDGPVRVESRGETGYAVHGTPADCVRIGLSHLYPDAQWVLSGINLGGNLGVDVYMSGTVAAARESAFLGIPAIAVSQYVKTRKPLDWDQAALWTGKVITELTGRTWIPRTFWNINLPHLESGGKMPEVVFCDPCKQPIPADYNVDGELYHYAGRYSERPMDQGADVDVCFSGNISVSLIHL